MDDSVVQMSIDFDTIDAEETISDLSKKLIKSMKKTENEISPLEQVEKDIEKTEEKIKNMQKALDDFGKTKVTVSLGVTDNTEEIKKLQKEVESKKTRLGITSMKYGKTSESYLRLSEEIENSENKLKELLAQQGKTKTEEMLGKDTEAYKKQTKAIENEKISLKDLIALREQFKDELKGDDEEEPKEKRTFKDSFLYKSFTGFGKIVGGLALGPMKALIKTNEIFGKKSNKSFGLGLKKVIGYSLGIRGLASLISKLKSSMTSAFKGISELSGTFKNSWNTMQGSFKQMSTAVSTAVAPLVNFLAPVISNIASLFTRAANSVAKFFAALTGQKSVVLASENTQKYADAIRDSSDAAKKALGSYDKLNVITDQGSETTGLATENLEDSYINNIEDMLKAGDFTELGKQLGEKLNEALTNLGGKWPQIQETAKKIGSSIGTFIEGFIKVDGLGKNIGLNIAEALDSVVYLVQSFFNNLSMMDVGNFLGNIINGIFENFDFAALASTLTQIFVAIPQIVTGVIETVDWSLVVDKIIEFVKNIDYGLIFSTFCEGLGATIGAGLKVLYELGKNIIDGLKDGIDLSWSDVWDWIKEHIFQPFINGFKKAFGIHSPSTVMQEMGKYLIEGLKNGIGNVWDKIKDAFENTKNKLSETWNNIKTNTSNIWNNIKSSLSNSSSSIKNSLIDTFNNLKSSLGNIFDGIWSKIKNVINSILGGVEKMANGVVNAINSMIRALNGLHFSIPSWVPGLGGKSFGLNIPTISNVSIPKLAQGAVIPPNQPFMAMLGDQTSGTNIEAPLETIQQALANVLTQNQSNQPIVLQLNGKDIAKVVWDENEKRYKQTGRYAY